MAGAKATLFLPRGGRSPRKAGRTQKSVLICDQNRELCKTMARIINTLGYHAVAATDGGTAFRLLDVQMPDLIIIGEDMPGMRASDFIDFGHGTALKRRALLIEKRTAHQPRWLPTLSKPMEVTEFASSVSRLLCDS